MAIFSELRDTLEGLESRMGDVDIDVLLTAMRRLDDDAIVGALAGAAAVANCAERMLTVGAGVVAERSRREDGHSGLAASRGHRNATSLVQSIVGGTRTDAARAVRLGESLVEGADAASAVDAGGWAEPAGGTARLPVRGRVTGLPVGMISAGTIPMMRMPDPEPTMGMVRLPMTTTCGCRGTSRCARPCSTAG